MEWWAVFWAASGAVGQVAAALLATSALIYSVRTYWWSLHVLHYNEIDKLYCDILKLAIASPHLRNPAAIRTEEQKVQYEAYANLVWNFVESVYDRAHKDAAMLATWRSAIEFENRIHRDWFDRPELDYLYKGEFRKWVRDNFPKLPPADSSAPPKAA